MMDILDIFDFVNLVFFNCMFYFGGNIYSMIIMLDMNYFFLCDEQDGLVVCMYDIFDFIELVQVVIYIVNF